MVPLYTHTIPCRVQKAAIIRYHYRPYTLFTVHSAEEWVHSAIRASRPGQQISTASTEPLHIKLTVTGPYIRTAMHTIPRSGTLLCVCKCTVCTRARFMCTHVCEHSQHEKQVQVLFARAAVEVAKFGCVGHMIRHHARPQQTAEHHHRPSLVTLTAPAAWGREGGREGGREKERKSRI